MPDGPPMQPRRDSCPFPRVDFAVPVDCRSSFAEGAIHSGLSFV